MHYTVSGSHLLKMLIYYLQYLKLDNEPELREAQNALFNVNSPSGW